MLVFDGADPRSRETLIIATTATPRPLPPAVLDRLRCPRCGRSIREVDGGGACEQGHSLPHRSGYLDASDGPVDSKTERTFRSFGYEWTHFEAIPGQDEVSWREYFADVPVEDLKGRVGLDAGCGQGRFSQFTARQLDALVALDGSDAVVAAAGLLADQPNVAVVKADLRRAPFADGSFDFISCLGVLHHLEDPEEGFKALARLLSDNGILLLYLYSRPPTRGFRAAALAAAAGLRRLTVTLPHPALRVLSAPIAMGLHTLVILPGRLAERRGSRLAALPLAPYRNRPFRSIWLDTFDRLSAPIEKRYVWEDVEPWFRHAGLVVESVSPTIGLNIVARRPSGPEV